MNENEKFAYKFTNKVDGTVKYGLAKVIADKLVTFQTLDGELIEMSNPLDNGTFLSNPNYYVELEMPYTGELPTWGND